MTQPSASRDRQVIRVLLVEGAANLVILIIKIVVGLATHSLAILADAMHSLTDVANNLIALVVVRLSTKPPDREHPYGHRKFETLAVFGLATLLTVLAIELALHALRREPAAVLNEPGYLGMMFVVLAINVGLTLWQRHWARRLNSDILLADASHTLADVLTTLAVIAGWQLSALGFPAIDTLCALAVAAMVLALAFSLFRRAVPVLVDHQAVDPERIAAAAAEVTGVRSVHRVRSRWQGSQSAVDLAVVVDAQLPSREAHNIADSVELALRRNFGVQDVQIHIEPDDAPAPPDSES